MSRAKGNGKAPDVGLPGDTPLVLAREGAHGLVVHALNAVAREAGIGTGARVTDMRALCPELIVADADLDGDTRALERLVLWCRRWSPVSAADGTDGVVLDATGASHLWGGDGPMLSHVQETLAGIGFSARLAMAPTHGAAWALARFAGDTRVVCEDEEVAGQLASLSPEALRLNGETVLLLRRLGLKTIGALIDIPRLSLARRFADADDDRSHPLRRLDQALGRVAEPVFGPVDPVRHRALVRFAEPVMDVAPHVAGLARDLCRRLARHGLGARALRLAAYRVDGETGTVDVATAQPNRDPEHLARLFEGRFDWLDPGFGIDAIALEATLAEPLEEAQARLDGDPEHAVEIARLVDRLCARLGPDAVVWPGLNESHIPERAESWMPTFGAVLRMPGGICSVERPLRMLDPPEPVDVLYSLPEGPPAQFVWRRLVHRVLRHAGPERIAPEWWREPGSARLRDYYRIEDSDGRRYWLFRDGLHDDGRGGPPRWFLHGLFA